MSEYDESGVSTAWKSEYDEVAVSTARIGWGWW